MGTKSFISLGITASGSICGITTNSSGSFKGSITTMILRARAWGLPLSSESFTGTVAGSGPRGRSGKAPHFTLRSLAHKLPDDPSHDLGNDHFLLRSTSIPSRNFSVSDISPMSRRSCKGIFLINLGVAMICSTRANRGFSAISTISSIYRPCRFS